MFRPRETFVANPSVFECWGCTARTRNGAFSADDRFRCYDCFGLDNGSGPGARAARPVPA